MCVVKRLDKSCRFGVVRLTDPTAPTTDSTD